MKYDKRIEAPKKRLVAIFQLEFPDHVAVARVIEAAESVPGVRRIIVQGGV